MTMAQPTGSMQRSSFLRQPARILLVDLSFQFDEEACLVVQEALEHFFSLVCSLGGPCRLPFFGLFALGAYPEAVFPLQNTRGNFGRIRGALTELVACRRAAGIGAGGGGCLSQGVQQAAEMFRRQAQNLLQTAGYWAQLEISVLTCRHPSAVVKQLELATRQADMDSLKKAQVIYMNNPERFMLEEDVEVVASSQVSMTSESEKSSDSDIGGIVECVPVQQDVLSLENLFKTWLQDCSTDSEHLHLLLPGQEDGESLSIKCDIHERILSPDQLPGGNQFMVQCDSPGSRPGASGGSVKGSTGTTLPVYVLRATRRLPTDAICESALFGLPIIVRATACWKMDWDDLETNNQHFTALCRSLKERDQVLLARLEPPSPAPCRGSGFRYQVPPPEVRGYFLLVAAHSRTLLLKSVAVRELMMPCDVTVGEDPVSESVKLVGDALDQVPEAEAYNPLMMDSGLYETLSVQLTKNVSGSAAKRKNKSVVATQSQTAGSLVARRGDQPRVGVVKPKVIQDTFVTEYQSEGDSDQKRPRQVSGRDFYGRVCAEEFPTEL